MPIYLRGTINGIRSELTIKRVCDPSKFAPAEYRRLSKANLLVIDDIMLFPVEKAQAVNLFNFINQLYGNTSYIITTNKMPAEWGKCWMMKLSLPLSWTGYFTGVRSLI